MIRLMTGETFCKKLSPVPPHKNLFEFLEKGMIRLETGENRSRDGNFDARHRKQARGGMSVFSYVIADESRSFRSIAQKIQARF